VSSVETTPRAVAQKPRFEDVYLRERDYLWKSLRRLGIPERHLEDVAHDVLVVVHRKLSDYDPSRPIRPWLFGIAMRTASDFRRSFKNVLETPEQDLDPPDIEARVDAPDRALEASEQRTLALRALSALDDRSAARERA
jgi:RNA polymerase sigma-70 factor (ECF subfamily)